MLLISSLTVSGQFTPQRLVINGQKGIFLSEAEERAVLSALVELRYYSNSAAIKDSIIFDMAKSISDKNFEINLLTTKYNESISDAKKYAKDYNDLIEEYNKLGAHNMELNAKLNGSLKWNLRLGASVLLLGTLLILTN